MSKKEDKAAKPKAAAPKKEKKAVAKKLGTDDWKLISSAGGETTKAMELKGQGCVITVSSKEGKTSVFIPKARIVEEVNAKGKVINRSIV